MPQKIITGFVRLFCFWILLFECERITFLLYNHDKIHTAGWGEIFSSFFHALPLDISTACYLMAVPVFISVGSFFSARLCIFIQRQFFTTYAVFIILVFSIITSSELGIYDEWGIKLHYKALLYIRHPSEIFQTAGWGLTCRLLLIFLLQSALMILIFLRWFREAKSNIPPVKKSTGILFASSIVLLSPGILLLGMRGGVKPIAINQSASYYSRNNTLNNAAVNSGWNLVHSITQNHYHLGSNPYLFCPHEEAEKQVSLLYACNTDTVSLSILTNPRPNVVLFILESWSADLVKSLGGFDSITPFFDSLAQEGILFDSIYASGDRSEQGNVAVLSGYPAQPATSIIIQPGKFSRLPCLAQSLGKEGYNTSYYFGGQLSYGNIKAYLVYNRFDRIIEEDDVESVPHGKLGIHDEFMLRKQLRDLRTEKEPFFSTLFTLSTHPPWDIPQRFVFNWGGSENGIINTAHYSDACFSRYFAEAKKEKWFDNTLFVFIADHGRNTPRNHNFYSPDYRKIPLLLYGNVIKKEFRGMKSRRIGSQVDLAATLLRQMKIDAGDFKWSKDLLNPACPGFAYYAFIDGLGWVRPGEYFVYENNLGRFYEEKFLTGQSKDQLVKEGRSYLQVLYTQYLGY